MYPFLAILIIGGFFLLYGTYGSSELEYNYNKGSLNTFVINGEYVVFDTLVNVKNNTNRDITFFMFADMKSEMGLVSEEKATAMKKDSLEREQFTIKANSSAMMKTYFKAKKGQKNTKKDRNPPEKVIFEIIK